MVDVARVDRTTMSMILEGDRDSSHEVSLLDGREPGDLEVHLRAGVVRTRIAAAGDRGRRSSGARARRAGGPQRRDGADARQDREGPGEAR